MEVDAPRERAGSIGRVRFASDDRVLALTVAAPVRISAFRGAGQDVDALARAIPGVKEQRPDLVFVLGELGPTAEDVQNHLEAFESIGAVVVVLASGADLAEALHDGFDDAETTRVFDGRALRAVTLGDDVFVLASGAPDGRYAASDAHCGFSEKDAESLEDVPEGRRWLVSWAAPSGGGPHAVGRGFAGLDAGSARIASLARSLEAKGGLFGFPTTRALLPGSSDGASAVESGTARPDLRIAVTRLAGAPDSLFDGGRQDPAAAHFELSREGLAYIGNSVSPGH